MYDFYTEQLAACDQEIERTFSVIKPRWQVTTAEEAAIMAEGVGKKDNFHMLSKGEEYRPVGAAEYEQQFKERQVQFLKRKAANLGLELVPV